MIFLTTIFDGIFDAFGTLGNTLYDFVKYVLEMLPKSPLAFLRTYTLPAVMSDGIHTLNYFVPVSGLIVITNTWLTCMLIYYFVRILLNWLKAEA